MTRDTRAYEEAIAKLNYIEELKQKLGATLDRLTTFSASGMFISARDYDYANACIREVIDELFYDETSAARLIKESWEDEERRKMIRELGTL